MRRLVRAGDVVLCVETFGAPADQPVVLIAGSGACMYSWPDEFCALLAGRGRFVVRYDHRDTGRSTAYPVGTVGYGLRDLAGDVFRLLDAHGLARAHLVGASMGGMVAQVAALREPARVASLTLLSTSCRRRRCGYARSWPTSTGRTGPTGTASWRISWHWPGCGPDHAGWTKATPSGSPAGRSTMPANRLR